MGASVGTDVGDGVDGADGKATGAPLELRLLGAIAVRRDGVELPLPASRKARALLAVLALADRAQSRGALCDLLWDGADDPRGELRWCLSRLRKVLDGPGRRRLVAEGDSVWLDLSDCSVDVRLLERALADATGSGADAAGSGADAAESRAPGAQPCPPGAALLGAVFAEGLDPDDQGALAAWLTAQRRHWREAQLALLEQLARRASGSAARGWLEQWVALSPFDVRAQAALLAALLHDGRADVAQAHVAAVLRRFAAEGLDPAPLRAAWSQLRTEAPAQPALAPTPGVPAQPLGPTKPTVPAKPPAPGLDHADAPVPESPGEARRASILVMPFADGGGPSPSRGGTGDGLAHDLILRLAKLRSLFVIAEGTAFALRDRSLSPAEAARLLAVDYLVSGSVQRRGEQLRVAVELVRTDSARIVWASEFDEPRGETLSAFDELGDRIVSAIAGEVESAELRRAVLRPPNLLDAWEAHHRGLWHMYRFSRDENLQARHWFGQALRLDPSFSRAHAGLSFTHFQDAFQGWADPARSTEHAYSAASQSLLADEHDPAAHWAMGRALWLRGRKDAALDELEQCVDLSPNFALGHYTLAFVHSQAGDPQSAIDAADRSRRLSPHDPLMFGMLGARAMALVRLGRFDEAAEWSLRAASRPNAHAHILGIAAFSLALADRLDEGRVLLEEIRRSRPGYDVDEFFTAMRFPPGSAALFVEGARRLRG